MQLLIQNVGNILLTDTTHSKIFIINRKKFIIERILSVKKCILCPHIIPMILTQARVSDAV